jgi:RNA polymerase sigma-70 factor (ECF subfamily)
MLQQQEAQPMVDVAQFEAIFERWHTPINSYIYHLVGNNEQAHDLAQDVFMKAYRVLVSGTTIPESALSSWLYRIATNTATDMLRHRKLITWTSINDWDSNDDFCFEDGLAEHEEVQQTLDSLPYKYTACLLLQSEGFGCDEIAAILDITSPAVKMRLKRGKEKFIKIYQSENNQC